MKGERTLLAMLVGAAGLYTLAYVVTGPDLSAIRDEHLAQIQGCYSLSGIPLLRVQGSNVVSGKEVRGFEAVREKSRDVLLMDNPVKLRRSNGPQIVTAGNASKVEISYGPPVRLSFWDEDDNEVLAEKARCTDKHSRLSEQL